ncbi:MAG: hypothetical protein PHH93_12495 [Prolixibacteraceae bacterium]|nr:hypothetical protein [Prolixibacteraceae bacterium]
MNRVIWNPMVQSIDRKRSRSSFKIESSGSSGCRQAAMHKVDNTECILNFKTLEVNTTKCLLLTATSCGLLQKTLKGTSSGKVFRKTERTTQRFMP